MEYNGRERNTTDLFFWFCLWVSRMLGWCGRFIIGDAWGVLWVMSN